MSTPTHAALATFRLDLDREREQREGLERFIVPGVKQAPGFVSGAWTLDRATSESVALITFSSAEQAEAFAGSVRGNADNQRGVGIDLVSVSVVEVTATA